MKDLHHSSTVENVMKYVGLVLGVMVLIFMVAGSVILLENTLINRIAIIGISIAIAVASSIPLAKYWGRITGMRNIWINSAINTAAVGIVICFSFLAINYFGADFASGDASGHGVIERRYQKTRYRTRRVGRRTYAQGAPYQVYFLDVSIPGWGKRDFEVGKKKYDTVRTGDTVSLSMAQGSLGFPVVNPSSIKALHPRKESKSRRCRFFGTSGRK